MRINNPDERDALILKMMTKYKGWIFKVWLVWFMQSPDFKIGPTEIGNRLGKSRQNVSQALKILRKNGDLSVVTQCYTCSHPVLQIESPSVTNVTSGDSLTRNLENQDDIFSCLVEETKSSDCTNDCTNEEDSFCSLVEETKSSDYLKKLQVIIKFGPKSWNKFCSSLVENITRGFNLTSKQKSRVDDAWLQTKNMANAQSIDVTRPAVDPNWLPPENPPEPIQNPFNYTIYTSQEIFADLGIDFDEIKGKS